MKLPWRFDNGKCTTLDWLLNKHCVAGVFCHPAGSFVSSLNGHGDTPGELNYNYKMRITTTYILY